MASLSLDRFLAQVPQPAPDRPLPPVEQWQPAQSGEIDIRIARDGTWYHEGSPFTRPALVQLFASILRREEDGDYYLVTPAEKLRIQVEDAPFVAIDLSEVQVDGLPVLEFSTSLGDRVRLDQEHAFWVEEAAASGEPSPYIRVRQRLNALVARPLFYRLVDMAELEENGGVRELVIVSAGNRFSLGRVD